MDKSNVFICGVDIDPVVVDPRLNNVKNVKEDPVVSILFGLLES